MLAVQSQRMFGAGVLVMGCIVGMGDVLARPLFLGALVVDVGLVELRRKRLVQRGRNRSLDRGGDRRLGMMIIGRRRGRSIVGVTGVIVVVVMMIVMMRVFGVVRFVAVIVLMTVMIVMRVFGVSLALVRMIVVGGCCRLGIGVFDDGALHALATVAAARIAMARATAAVMAVLVLFLRLAMGALVGLDQRLTIGDRDLIIVGMDFAEGEEAVPIAAIFDKGRLQRRFDATTRVSSGWVASINILFGILELLEAAGAFGRGR
jgi:hypothetical protein